MRRPLVCHCCGKEPMQYNPANPLIVQGDRTILLEVDNPLYARRPRRDRAVCRAGEEPRAYSHLSFDAAFALERGGRRHAGGHDDRGTRALLEVSAPLQRAGRPARAGQPLRPSAAGAHRRAASTDHPGPPAARRAGTAARRARLSGRTRRRDQLRHRRRQPGGFEAGLDLGRLSGRRPGGLHRRCRACRSGFARRPVPACRFASATIKRGPSRRFTPAATFAEVRA